MPIGVFSPILVVLAAVFLWPRFNRTWNWSLCSHAFSCIAAIGLGRLGADIAGFGFAVGDPPYGTGEAEFDFFAIWLNATAYVIATLYALRALIWLSVSGFHRLKGSY
jgi:hypothetical protein